MIKRTILAACVAAFALAALPALAAAEEPKTTNPGDPFLEGVTEGTEFSATGGERKLTSAIGTIKCKENQVTGGKFFDPETGSLKVVFKVCTSPLGTSCQSGATSGVIETTTLPFHLKTVAHKNAAGETKHEPGILITPGAGTIKHSNGTEGTHFYTVECGFVGKIVVGGNGLIGTITKPKEGEEPSNTATVSFSSTEAGSATQTHRFITDHQLETEGKPPVEYDLKASLNGGETKTAALDMAMTITFAGGMKPILKTTPTP